MAYPAYSERFINVQGGSGTIGVTIPAGRRAVLREITVTNLSGTTGQVTVRVAGQVYWDHKFQVAEKVRIIDCRVVIYAEEILSVAVEEPSCGALLSGYLLEDTAGRIQLEREWRDWESAEQLPAA